jgi:hypothetical protein
MRFHTSRKRTSSTGHYLKAGSAIRKRKILKTSYVRHFFCERLTAAHSEQNAPLTCPRSAS